MEKTTKKDLTDSLRSENGKSQVYKQVNLEEKSRTMATPEDIRKLAKSFVTNKDSQVKDNILTLPDRVEHMVKSGAGVSSFDLERVIGTNDMVRINYLQRGVNAARTICRIFISDPVKSESWWGTGFLISPNLLITNNHVIPEAALASTGFAEFGYEADVDGMLQVGKRFRLLPEKSFITSDAKELDFTIVAISEVSEDGEKTLADYGFLRLDPKLKKIDELEFVTIIQHPNGNEKQIAIRENKVIKIGDALDKKKDNFLWYASDTAPGSSGAPAFNDSWQVVAIHHSAVPLSEGDTEYKANEGVRTSKIIERTIEMYNALDAKDQRINNFIKQFIDDATGVRPFVDTKVGASIISPNVERLSVDFERAKKTSKNVHPVEYYSGRRGYDEDFLGLNIPLPELTNKALAFGNPAQLINSEETELKYTHFSVVHNENRKIAFFTAVNINGKTWKNLNRSNDKWWFDSRIPLSVQVDDDLYGNEPINGNKGWFDRGHLVRRLDPVWGTVATANQANEDTFHWTNCSPQYWGFNQGQELWQGLENYILYNTDKEDVKACVFTGPIFDKDDEEHRGIFIPQYFWKLIVVTDSDDKLYSSAYRVSQKKYAENIPFEIIPVGDFNHFQITVKKLESLTGLRFADVIRDHDVIKGKTKDIGLKSLADVEFARRK